MAGVAAGIALAADDGKESSAFVRMLEGMLSGPGRQVSIEGLDGIFSSSPTVKRITVSDGEGAWLEVDDAALVWSRAALIRRVLDIDSLTAERVSVLRKPIPAADSGTGGGSSGGGGFAGLPVDVKLGDLSVRHLVLGEALAGRAAELSVAGSASLTQAALATELTMKRLDAPGALTADLRLEPQANVLTAELSLSEPAGGLVATLLDLRGAPAIDAALSGTGPLDKWQATLEMRADGTRVVAGAMSITRQEDGYRVRAQSTAQLETIVPADYAALVAGESTLALDLTRHDDGAVAVQSATLHSGGADLTASGLFSTDLVPQSADVSLTLGQAGRTELPLAPGHLSLAGLSLKARLEAGASAAWKAELAANGIAGDFGNVDAVTLSAAGKAKSLGSPAARSATFRLDASAQGVAPSDPKLAAAFGRTTRVVAAGSWSAGSPVTFDNLQATLAGTEARFAGTMSPDTIEGAIGLSVADLSRFASLAGRPLAGGIELQASGSASPAGTFDLKLDGTATDLALGVAALDPLMKGGTKLSGGVARSGDGLAFDSLVVANDHLSAEVNGTYSEPAIDLKVGADIADLALVTPRAAGKAHLSARLTGTSAAPAVDAEATGTGVTLMGRPLDAAAARFKGVVAGPDTTGSATLGGTLGGTPVQGSAKLAAGEDGARVIEDLVLAVGDSKVSGGLTVRADGLLSGAVRVVSPDLSKVAPLFLVDARGMLSADVTLGAQDGGQSATFKATATDIAYETVTLKSASLDGQARELFTAPQIDGIFSLNSLKAGGLTVVTASGKATRQGDAAALTLDARLSDGKAALAASLSPEDGGLAIGLDRFTYSRSGIDVALASPSTIRVRDGSAELKSLTLKTGGGSVAVTGRAGSTLDLTAELLSVPAALANGFVPDLGATGAISGSVVAKGAAADPDVRFDLNLTGGSVAAARNAGVGPVAVATKGNLAKGTLKLDTTVTGARGLALKIAGAVQVKPAMRLDLGITGSVPLALANQQLADRGAALDGALAVDVKVSGDPAAPRFSGRLSSKGGGLVDPASGIVLRNLVLSATLNNDRLVVETLTADSGEGTVSGSGSIGLDPRGGFPLDLKLAVRKGRYVDGALVAARFDADLTVEGSVAEGPLIQGKVTLDRTEVSVPEQLPGGSVAVDVEHVDPPAPVEQTLEAARSNGRTSSRASDSGSSAGIRLGILVVAPRAIFVRGRGLDAELGGRLQISGSTNALIASGAFEMVRGRLDILTQRITFDSGTVTFAGDLDPLISFSGSTTSNSVSITVTVSGRASDPEITFSSVPELPQDEILAQLIFNKTLGDLSAVQIARLAAAVATLSGGSGGGILGQLRATTGLDDLDIVTDDTGAPAVAAGRYITNNVYLGVQQGSTTDSSRVTIDLDITKGVKARAGYSAEGESSLGVYFEKEY